MEQASLHLAGGVGADAPMHLDDAPAHLRPDVCTGMAPHGDPPVAHPGPDSIQLAGRLGKLDLAGERPAEREQVIHPQPAVAAGKLHCADVRGSFAGEAVGNERR